MLSDPQATDPGASQPETAFTILLEKEKRLSDSLLWQAQRRYFERTGIEAWRSGAVPYYVTNNPRLASRYAETVFGYLRDWHNNRTSSEHQEPLHIVELGAGCGRFGFFFLKSFSGLLRRSSFSQTRFCYVMTDFAESNLAFLRSHEALRPFVERGLLDFALFDVECDDTLHLEHSGEILKPGSLQAPLVVIANYVFDGTTQDAFHIKDGHMFEHLISVYSDVAEPDLSAPEAFEHLAVTYADKPALEDYYPEPEFNAILHDYGQNLKETTILFPASGLRCVKRLASVSTGGFLLLSGDKGDVQEDFLDGGRDPAFVMHGSFSMQVNYHAMGQYFAKTGGTAFTMHQLHSSLNVSAFCLTGESFNALAETEMAYDRAIGSGSVDDFFVLRRGIQEHYDKLEIKHLLALLRSSDYDPKILWDCLPVVWARIEDASEPIRREILRIVHKVWENYYHLGEEHDLAFALGRLLFSLGEYQDALRLFQESCRLYGDSPQALWNMGLCYCGLKKMEEAAACFSRTLNSNGEFQTMEGLQER